MVSPLVRSDRVGVHTQEAFMERSIFAALIGGLLGITTLGGLALVGSAPGYPAAPSSRPEGDGRLLEPITYENISVFPVVSSYGEDGDVLVGDGLKEPPIALRARRGGGRVARRRADESQAAKSGDTEQTADEGGKNRTFHESLLCVNPDPVRANQRGYDS